VGGALTAPNIPSDLKSFVESLARDHSDLSSRVRAIVVGAKSASSRITLHGHYLSFRDGKPTIGEFVDLISSKVVLFCLNRRRIKEVQDTWLGMTPDKITASASRLYQEAIDLFKRARKDKNRNGEFGELVAYLFMEHFLKAPQLVAKMSLKTNTQMPVHGSDGIHVLYDEVTDELTLLWGEAKCYGKVNSAISEAVNSIAESLEHNKMQRELTLVDQYADLSDIDAGLRKGLLAFLDPTDERYNRRLDRSVALIAFDFGKFSAVEKLSAFTIDAKFVEQLQASLISCAQELDSRLSAAHSIQNHRIDFFFLPVPSIEDMRTLFQNKIGWTP